MMPVFCILARDLLAAIAGLLGVGAFARRGTARRRVG